MRVLGLRRDELQRPVRLLQLISLLHGELDYGDDRWRSAEGAAVPPADRAGHDLHHGHASYDDG